MVVDMMTMKHISGGLEFGFYQGEWASKVCQAFFFEVEISLALGLQLSFSCLVEAWVRTILTN